MRENSRTVFVRTPVQRNHAMEVGHLRRRRQEGKNTFLPARHRKRLLCRIVGLPLRSIGNRRKSFSPKTVYFLDRM